MKYKDYVSLEVCKLIKELNIPIMERLFGYVTAFREPTNGTLRRYGMRGNNPERLLYCPTIYTLQTYLREKHNIYVSVTFNYDLLNSWVGEIVYIKDDKLAFYKKRYPDYVASTVTKTYEEAYSKTLKRALTILKNEI